MSDSANINKAVFPHLLRHTFATNAINKGMPISSLCDLMGHSSIDTTRIYAKNSSTKLKYDYEMHI
jgi:integrase/recombinase XerD